MIILGRSMSARAIPHPLPLSAGELVRVAIDVLGIEPHDLEHLLAALLALLARPHPVDDQRLGHDLAEGHPRVERGIRVLEDELHVPPVRP